MVDHKYLRIPSAPKNKIDNQTNDGKSRKTIPAIGEAHHVFYLLRTRNVF